MGHRHRPSRAWRLRRRSQDGPGILSAVHRLWSILESSTNYDDEPSTCCSVQMLDVPVPGDYDGDGDDRCRGLLSRDRAMEDPRRRRTQLRHGDRERCGARPRTFRRRATTTATARPISPCIGRPQASGDILQSRTDYATNVTIALGTSTDVPVPADYDGDGVTDIAVFTSHPPAGGRCDRRPATSRRLSSRCWAARPTSRLRRDYDGDGKPTSAVFHAPAPGRFCIRARATRPG